MKNSKFNIFRRQFQTGKSVKTPKCFQTWILDRKTFKTYKVFSYRDYRQWQTWKVQSLFRLEFQTGKTWKYSKSFQTEIPGRKNWKNSKSLETSPIRALLNKTSRLKRLWLFHVYRISNPSLKSTLNIFNFFPKKVEKCKKHN